MTQAGASSGATITGAWGLCPALSGHAPYRCGKLEGGIATSHQDAGFGVGVSHGLLLGKVCVWGIISTAPPPRLLQSGM